MAIIRWDPFAELNNLHNQVNSLFNDTYGGVGAQKQAPATDIYSDDKSLTIEAHLPNFDQEDIDVEINNGELSIKAEHHEKDEKKEKGKKYIVRESITEYYRHFALPRNVNADKVDAHYENGVLKVVLPFKELPKPKKISIASKASKAKDKK
jgi:HSP20 family protein